MKRYSKSLAILIVAISFLSNNLFAQESPLKYGARVGVSISYFSVSPKFEGGNPGLVAGGFLQYQIIPLLELGADILFHQQRGQIEDILLVDPSYIRNTSNSLTLQTLEVPVMAGLNLPKIAGLSVGVKAGYSFSYIIAANEHRVHHYYSPDGSILAIEGGKENMTSDYLRYQNAFVGALCLSIPVESNLIKGLNIDLRYRLGLSPLEKGYGILQGRAGELSSQSLQMVLGFQF